MLETQLHFNFKDMFRAPRLALGRRMMVMLEALLASYIVYLFMTYLALLVEGHSLGSIWNDFHLMPSSVLCLADSTFGHILVALSYTFSIIILWLGLTSVAKITIKEYKGDLFYSSRDGWKWAMKNWFPVFFGPISIGIVVGFFVLLAALFGWLAQWPVLDIIFYGLLFVIFLPTALFLAFSALAFGVGLFMSPSIVACAEEDTMGSMFGSYTLLWNQPVRLIAYTVMTIVAAMIGYQIFYVFILSAFKFIEMVFGHEMIMGNAYVAIKQVGMDLFGNYSFLPSNIFAAYCCDSTCLFMPGCLSSIYEPVAAGCGGGGCGGCASAAPAVVSATITQTITGVIVGIFTLLAHLAVPAYALATLATGFATSFIVLTKHKDDQDLIKRKDADERAEAEAAEAEEEAQTETPADQEETKTDEAETK
ncbi:MAG: hypothetical protein HOB84_08215 [Candidatus Marinimicrobia bacterium]|jgi:hypothetical protein|nr:hypothetical protein [Candidatus Neomarinimicrobiota bacterium]MBT4362392.1 hypothetical protein [Candidatus Neomarinimicrobiota bacterium]MBT4714741.1 hypothetical protein [Candidatus Neomarinimicrobiota bacterium]MBT5270853.1 hypothetical protein [Candidatus Neomarinimicrobiota bacterium]MBT6012691.1 hypothetical protein [Candidatus Neomarinimicrobiota bacterium]